MLPGVEFARKRRVHCHDAKRRGPTKAPPGPAPAWPLRRASAMPTDSIDEAAALALLRLEETLRSRRRHSDLSSAPSSSPAPSTSTSSSSYPTSLGRLWNRHFGDVVGRNLRGRGSSGATSSDGDGIGHNKNSNSSSGSSRSKALERTVSKIEVCAVCLDQVEADQRAMWLPCSHKFHSECVLPWLAGHPHCPCCRTHLPAPDLPLLLL